MKIKALIILFIPIIIYSCSSSNDDTTDNNDDSTNPTIDRTLNRNAVGTSANDLLSDNTFTSMVVELVYVEGFEPSQTTINNFVSFLESRTFKPNGITVEKRAIASTGTNTYSIDNIRALEIEERQNYNSENKIAVWAFFANGNSSNDSGNSLVLGTAYWNTSFVIFEETIQNLSDSTLEPNRTVLETTVINHEFGHILGLTNLGSPMQQAHEDEENPKHCNVDSCLMFWATESSSGISSLLNMSSAPQLDAQCIADLQANGGK